jgi:hypothetical protein
LDCLLGQPHALLLTYLLGLQSFLRKEGLGLLLLCQSLLSADEVVLQSRNFGQWVLSRLESALRQACVHGRGVPG